MGVAAEHGGVPGDLHFDVSEDALVLESLLKVLALAVSPLARDGMAGQTDDGLRWRVNREGEPIKVAFLGKDGGSQGWVAGRWGSYAVDVPWETAKLAVAEEQTNSRRNRPFRSLELLANTLEVKKYVSASSRWW